MIVALQIAYLPALYSSYSTRESLVALLESRAGQPAWGPELLARHQLVGITDTLPQLYQEWEVWSADVAESHTTYPILLLFRSPEAWLSWLTGLLAVLDAAAMHLALDPDSAPRPRPGSACGWASPCCSASPRRWGGRWTSTRTPKVRSN